MMEDIMPPLPNKKKMYSLEHVDPPELPNKQHQSLRSEKEIDASLGIKSKEPPLRFRRKYDEDVKLIAFNKSSESNEVDKKSSKKLDKTSVSSADGEATKDDNFSSLLSKSEFLRRSFETKYRRLSQAKFTNEEILMKASNRSQSVDLELDSTPAVSSLPSLAIQSRSTISPKDVGSVKSLRETFDEFRCSRQFPISAPNNSALQELKFKRISAMPQFLQARVEDKKSPLTGDEPPVFSKELVKSLASNLVTCHHNNTASKNLPRGAVATPFKITTDTQQEQKKRPEQKIEVKSPQCEDKRVVICGISPVSKDKSPKSPILDELFSGSGYQSEEGLSDDGELNDEDESLEFGRPSIDELRQALPIVFLQQHKETEKKGYLYKYTTGQTSRLTSKLVSNWLKRWATLDNQFLMYYASNKSPISRRVIPVSTISDVKSTDEHLHGFKIFTRRKRVFSFAAEKSDDCVIWTNMIMKAIIDSSNIANHDMMPGGDFYKPDKMGYTKVESLRGRKYMACKHGKLAVYNSYSDYSAYTPIFLLNLQLSNIRDVGKMKLQMSTPLVNYIFSFESQEETTCWKHALENGISFALGDDEVVDKVCENSSNRYCADCRAEGPEWAAINIGITLCQNCAGIHRKMANAKIRSLRMDCKVWSEALIRMMNLIGNNNSNKLWEHRMKNTEGIEASCESTRRSQFIEAKYIEMKYFNFHEFHEQPENLNRFLRENLFSNNIHLISQLIFSGADVNQVLEGSEDLNQNISPAVHELLKRNSTFDCRKSSSTSQPAK